MKFQIRRLTAALSVVILSATACVSSPSSSASASCALSVGSLYEPQNLDNAGGGGQGAAEALGGNVYEALFRLTETGAVEKSLVSDYTVSPDGLTYTFVLRRGVRFHSGTPMTSDDVRHSLRRILAGTSTSSRRNVLDMIKSVDAPDDHTVVVRLSSRSISLVYNLSQVWIVNHTLADPKTAEDGTGPYRLASWKRGATLTMERFGGYWGAAPKCGQVTFRYYTEAAALNNALLSGAVDVVTSVQSPDALAPFSDTSAFRITEGTSTTKLLLAFNCRRAPFDKPLVRRAVSAAIDDAKLLRSVWGERGMVIGSMVPPSDPWYEDLSGKNAYDVEAAKRMLAEAGYPGGFPMTLETPQYDPHPTIAEFVKSELAKVGITVTIDIISADEWYSRVFQHHDFAATLQEHVNDRDIRYYGDPGFYWGYDNPEVSDLIRRSESAKTTREQTELLRRANHEIVEDAASDWLYLNPQIVVASAHVTGYAANAVQAQFPVYGIDKR
ncbi:ABC transporter substrate-binding protein [Microbispora amethystogenes]|uniref:Peptide ABC transporter substrate-binding protein n=1 Tax=Microbispora amethystogenes TaxID=1427754 RepID=A0ABQ4FP05_9ACTN|nr:ABC transporter substrate-binding protein [Microbispora amethystogenes]GIH36518.1 peptide ABC transporter substrate-binding protein [Microbispora amethystogenes]